MTADDASDFRKVFCLVGAVLLLGIAANAIAIVKKAGAVPCEVTDRNPCSAWFHGSRGSAVLAFPRESSGALRFDGNPSTHRRAVPAGLSVMVTSAALAAGVPAQIAHAVIRQESGYRAGIRGRAGEYGIGQIKCQTARGVGFTGSCSALLDPAVNLKFSMRYLRAALDRGGSGCAGVSLYQTGIYARPRCSAYGRAVMARAGR